MKLAIEKGRLKSVIDLLDSLTLKGKKSRQRSKLKKNLVDGFNEFVEDEQEVIKEHSYLDENGKPKIIDGVKYDVKDFDAFVEAKDELYAEEHIVEDPNLDGAIKTVKDVLLGIDREFSGSEADAYDYLCDKLEEATETE